MTNNDNERFVMSAGEMTNIRRPDGSLVIKEDNKDAGGDNGNKGTE